MTFAQLVRSMWVTVKSIYGRDPEGNVIEIQQTLRGCTFRLDKLPPIPT